MCDKEPKTPRNQPTKYMGKMYNGVPGAPIKKVKMPEQISKLSLDKDK